MKRILGAMVALGCVGLLSSCAFPCGHRAKWNSSLKSFVEEPSIPAR
jgi:hypothetical protein